MLEADRFWDRFAADAGPIEFWLTQPMQSFEPAALVVRRFWRGIVARSATLTPGTQLIVCTHCGPIRAIAAQAIGCDPGEPDHLESRHVVLDRAQHRATVRFRDATMEAGIPTDETPSWFASEC